MDDATASDNCGEVTIEVSRNRWRCCWQLRDRSHLHATDDAGNSARLRNHHVDTTAPEFTFVPADYTVMFRRDANGRRHGV